MEKKTKLIRDKALARYKESLSDSLVLCLTFFLLCGASLCLGFLGVDFALLGILLIGLPALLSFQLMLLRQNKKDGLSNAQAFRGFRLYYSFYFGVYRFWLSLLRSLLIFLLASLVFGISTYYLLASISPEFVSQANEFSQLLYQADISMSKILEAYENYGYLQGYSTVVLLLGFAVGGYMFIHEIGRNCFNLYARSLLAGTPVRFANAQFSSFFRRTRRDFYSFYYPCFWPGILLYTIGYASGASLGCFLTGNATYSLAFGFLGSLLFLCPFLPYYFYALDEYSKKAGDSFMAFLLEEAESALKIAEEQSEADSEETKQLRQDVAELKKRFDLKREEEKKEADKPDEDQNSSSGS